MFNKLFLLLSTVEEPVETPTWSWEELLTKVIDWAQTSGVKLLIGLVVLFILFGLVNGIAKRVRNKIIKKRNDKTIAMVAYKFIRYGGKADLFFVFLAYVGIDTAGIGAIIASFSVALGLALQGSLSNLAGWVIIIFMRPFKLGDYIEAQGMGGTVEDIKLFYTYIVTPDNKVCMIPNGTLANGNITNFSVKPIRRVAHTFAVAYDTDIQLAIDVIMKTLEADPLILKDPAPFVKVEGYGDNSINIVARGWAKSEDYWTVHFQMLDEVKKAFDENGIVIPFRQLDVTIVNEKE